VLVVKKRKVIKREELVEERNRKEGKIRALSQELVACINRLLWNFLNPWQIAIIRKARSWAITDARIAGRCSTPDMCKT